MTAGIGDDKQLWSLLRQPLMTIYSGSFRPNYYMASSKEHTAVNSEEQPLGRISLWPGVLKIKFSEPQVE